MYAAHHARLTVDSLALADSTGEATLYVPEGTHGEPTSGLATLTPLPEAPCVLQVRTSRLDDFGFTDVSFVKIDVEGNELGVLRGALETLERNRPISQVDTETRHGSSLSEVADYLSRWGYDGWFSDRRDLVPIVRLTPDHQQWARCPTSMTSCSSQRHDKCLNSSKRLRSRSVCD